MKVWHRKKVKVKETLDRRTGTVKLHQKFLPLPYIAFMQFRVGTIKTESERLKQKTKRNQKNISKFQTFTWMLK